MGAIVFTPIGGYDGGGILFLGPYLAPYGGSTLRLGGDISSSYTPAYLCGEDLGGGGERRGVRRGDRTGERSGERIGERSGERGGDRRGGERYRMGDRMRRRGDGDLVSERERLRVRRLLGDHGERRKRPRDIERDLEYRGRLEARLRARTRGVRERVRVRVRERERERDGDSSRRRSSSRRLARISFSRIIRLKASSGSSPGLLEGDSLIPGGGG